MPSFGAASRGRLETCHAFWIEVLEEVILSLDFSILTGHRGEADQNAAFDKKLSKLRWPNGKHNQSPSLAVDVAPYPIDWSNRPKSLARFYYLAGYIQAVVDRKNTARAKMGRTVFRLRWGGDWDGDMDFSDQGFDDIGHFEIKRLDI